MRNIKPKKEEYMINAMKKGESQEHFPTFRIDLSHLPEAKKWKIGTEYHIELGVKLVGLSQSKFDNSAEFEIKQIGTEEDEEESKDDEYEEEDED